MRARVFSERMAQCLIDLQSLESLCVGVCVCVCVHGEREKSARACCWAREEAEIASG